jgi:hypothetical protein
MKEWTDERISKRRSYQVDVVHASLVVGISLAARGRLAGPKLRPDLFDAKNFILSINLFYLLGRFSDFISECFRYP